MKNPNGFGTVYKLSGKRRKPWIARVTVGYETVEDELNPSQNKRKQVYKTLGYFKTRTEGIKALALYSDDPDFFGVKEEKPTFREIWEDNVLPQLEERLAEKSFLNYKYVFSYFSKIADKPVNKIKLRDVQSIFDEMSNLSTGYIGISKIVFNHIWKYALKNDYVQKDFSALVDVRSLATKKQKTVFTPVEIERIYRSIGDNNVSRIVFIMLFTGMRIGEVFSLEKNNIHLNERYMIGGSKTEAGKNRVIPIHKIIHPIIEDALNDTRNTSKYLFCAARGGKINYEKFIYQFKDFMKECETNHTIHECRHTFISMTSGRKFDQTRIKRIVGHKTNDITIDVYTHFYIEELIEEMDKLEVPFKI